MSIWVNGLILLTIVVANFAQAAEIKSINFYQKDSISYFEFAFGEEVPDPRKFTVRKDKQIIIDFPATNASKKVMRGLMHLNLMEVLSTCLSIINQIKRTIYELMFN